MPLVADGVFLFDGATSARGLAVISSPFCSGNFAIAASGSSGLPDSCLSSIPLSLLAPLALLLHLFPLPVFSISATLRAARLAPCQRASSPLPSRVLSWVSKTALQTITYPQLVSRARTYLCYTKLNCIWIEMCHLNSIYAVPPVCEFKELLSHTASKTARL